MCHGHWMHDRLSAGDPLEDLEFDTEDEGDLEDEPEREPVAALADD